MRREAASVALCGTQPACAAAVPRMPLVRTVPQRLSPESGTKARRSGGHQLLLQGTSGAFRPAHPGDAADRTEQAFCFVSLREKTLPGLAGECK